MNVALPSVTALMLATAFFTCAQDAAPTPTPLNQLLGEAKKNNPQILAASHAWRAATHVATQVATLPDPQFTVQQFSVGSPKPFAGFTNSNFAYIGFGASQELPYPGKLRLKGQIANKDADTQKAQMNALGNSVAEKVKAAYFRLAYIQQTLNLLKQNDSTLNELVQAGLARYRVGKGNQSDVLKAQLEHTKLVREITLHHADLGQVQASLKLLLSRPQASPDIVAENLKLTVLHDGTSDLFALVRRQNPEVRIQSAELTKQDVQLQSAQLGSKPDFSLGYMYQLTGDNYRDYYMLTFNVRLPRRKRVHAEIAEASELSSRSKEELKAQVEQQLSEVQKQYVVATSGAELLTEYRDGLIPQAQAAFRTSLASYQSNREDFRSVLNSFNDVLDLERDYQQELLDHEIAIARLETLTGATLR